MQAATCASSMASQHKPRPLPFDPDAWRQAIGSDFKPNLQREGLGFEATRLVETVRVRGSAGAAGIKPPASYPWLDMRDADEQMRHHIEHQPEDCKFGDVAGGGDSTQLTVLTWNAGNLDRIGVSPDGIAQPSLVLPFLTGKHHVALVQEAASSQAWRTFNTLGFRYLYSAIKTDDFKDGHLLILAGASGRKTLDVLESASIVNPWVSKPSKIAGERQWYLVGKISWRDPSDQDRVYTRAGRENWICCTTHVNNVLAKKTDAAFHVLKDFWRRMLALRVDIVGGDFNGCAGQSGANHGAERALRYVIENEGHAGLVYKWFRSHDSDCIVFVALSYSGEPVWQASQSEGCSKIKARDLHLRAGDGDWHRPLLTTLRLPGRHKRKRAELAQPLPPFPRSPSQRW